MRSVIKVKTIQASGGNAIITSNGSGKVTTSKINTPAFEVNLSSNQTSVADNTLTKVVFDSEVFDTDNAYDTSTYRFTPLSAGKYFVYAYIVGGAGGGNGDHKDMQVAIYKNGSSVKSIHNLTNTGYENEIDVTIHNTIDMNGSTDYLEIFGKINSVANSGANKFLNNECTFGAFRIGD